MAQVNFFHHARNNEIFTKKSRIPATLVCMWRDISILRDRYPIPNITCLHNFFRLPFDEVSTFWPRQMFNDSYKNLFSSTIFYPRDGHDVWAAVVLFDSNFLVKEIDFQLALQFHSNTHDSPIRNFSSRKFILTSNECLRLAVIVSIDSKLRFSMKRINSATTL